MRRVSPACLLTTVALAGCAPAEEDAAPTATLVTFTASDFAFTGPDHTTAGLVTLRLVNNGSEPHHAILARLDSGKTVSDALAAYAEDVTKDPPWITGVGGVSAVDPGTSAESTAMLEAGSYALLCFVSSADGQMHLQKGMVKALHVAEAEGPAAAEPAADIEIRMTDYAYALSGPLVAGTHTIRVVNDGPQVHEVQLVRFAPGKTLQDLMAFFAPGGGGGPPPANLLGGNGALSTGRQNYLTVTLAPGNYALVCFVPDEGDGMPHVAHGMVHTFTVS